MGLKTFGGYGIDDLRLAISEERYVTVLAPIFISWILSYTSITFDVHLIKHLNLNPVYFLLFLEKLIRFTVLVD